jgi:hypothetical protein
MTLRKLVFIDPCYGSIWLKTGIAWQYLVKVSNVELRKNKLCNSYGADTKPQTDGQTWLPKKAFFLLREELLKSGDNGNMDVDGK